MKFIEILVKIALGILFLGSLYIVFVFPFQVASRSIEINSVLIVLGLLYYIQLLIVTIESVYAAFAWLYNFKRKTLNILNLYYPKYKKDKMFFISKKGIFFIILTSYFLVVYSFAIGYLFLGNYISGSFTNQSVSFIDSLFLSFTSASVGPSGLTPTSTLTKSIVMSEIAIGLIYSILAFSLITSLILKGQNKT